MTPADLTATDSARSDPDELDREALRARIEVLTEENRRLREEYARSRRAQYRKTALALAAVGLVAALGGVAFPASQAVLFALAATGLFAAVLTYYLTPERFVTATVGEAAYAAYADAGAALATELGLRETRLYVPDDRPERTSLYVPVHATFSVPDAADRESLFVVTDDPDERGVALVPTGVSLFREFRSAIGDDLARDADPLANQLADALVEQFELVRSAEPDVDPADGRASVAVSDSALDDVERFDHPVASFLAVGFANGLGRPVELEVEPTDRADGVVTCTWDADDDGEVE